MKKIFITIFLYLGLILNAQIIPSKLTKIVSTNTCITVTQSGQSFSLTGTCSGVGSGSVITSPNGSVTVSAANDVITMYFDDNNLLSLVPSQLDLITSDGTNSCGITTNSSINLSLSASSATDSSGINIEADNIDLLSNKIKLNTWEVPTFPTTPGYYVLDGDGQPQSVSLPLNDFITVAPAPTTETVAVDTGLEISLEASTTYIIEGALFIGCSGTGGVKIAIDVPTGATFRIQGLGRGNNDSNFRYNTFFIDGSFSVGSYNTVNSQSGSVSFQGAITTSSTAGSIKIQFASSKSGETSTVYAAGSYLRAIK